MNSCNRSLLRSKLGLYMVTADLPGRGHVGVARAALDGGARIIQYRDKLAPTKVQFEAARALRTLCDAAHALLIVNDRLDIALAVEADGVHLGQDDMPVRIARRITGKNYIIGISASTVDEAVEAAKDGADYIGLGPIFPTPSKSDAAPPMGIEGLTATRALIDAPIVAIGGITTDNIEEVVAAGADAIAVISAVTAAPDMVAAARGLTDLIESAKQRIESKD